MEPLLDSVRARWGRRHRSAVAVHRDPRRHRAHLARLLCDNSLALSAAAGSANPPRAGKPAAARRLQPARRAGVTGGIDQYGGPTGYEVGSLKPIGGSATMVRRESPRAAPGLVA